MASELKRTAGFTLVEISISILILTVLAVSVLGSYGVALKSQSSTRDREVAVQAARTQMEQILAWPDFTTLVAAFNNSPFAAGTLEGTSDPPNAGIVTVDGTNPDLLLIRATVTWISPRGEESLAFSTSLVNPN